MTTINLYEVYLALLSICNVQQSGQIRPVSDFQYWMNVISNELFHLKCKEFQENQMLADELSPYLKTINIVVTKLAGQIHDLAALPADYQYFAGLRVVRSLLENTDILLEDGRTVQHTDPDYVKIMQNLAIKNLYEGNLQLIDNQMWAGAMGNRFKKPTYNLPLATQYSAGLKIAPKGAVQSVVLDYFRAPRACVFAYTIGAGDIVVYDPANSVQLEWTKAIEGEFINRLIKRYGLRTKDTQVYQVGDNEQKQNENNK